MTTFLVILFGVTTLVSAAVATWMALDRKRLRTRFAGLIDLEREITARRHAFNVELSRRQVVFDSELAARRRAVESELAKQTAELAIAVKRTTNRVSN
ncbi:MAG TPA: hypothetical protein VFP84_17935 [Kofleriaceae bacterium]|nr:hypothetical protein [Kofleriaceae bacterium]